MYCIPESKNSHHFLILIISKHKATLLVIAMRVHTMPKVGVKRRITLPIDQCHQAHIEPGDEYNSYVDNHGNITIIKKRLELRRDY